MSWVSMPGALSTETMTLGAGVRNADSAGNWANASVDADHAVVGVHSAHGMDTAIAEIRRNCGKINPFLFIGM
ncbi:hypothetical protein SDC9_107214 [bioreactor metagenome]|uniref:Uncharacterized protein n=1 Tax=bioreactor metagenome TaxID=1076179 RepID=A0A645BB24_9ZZZZ